MASDCSLWCQCDVFNRCYIIIIIINTLQWPYFLRQVDMMSHDFHRCLSPGGTKWFQDSYLQVYKTHGFYGYMAGCFYLHAASFV